MQLGNFSVDVEIQQNGKLDVWMAHEGSSGAHYTDVSADEVGQMLAEMIECYIDLA